jgi:hypothetical protein
MPPEYFRGSIRVQRGASLGFDCRFGQQQSQSRLSDHPSCKLQRLFVGEGQEQFQGGHNLSEDFDLDVLTALFQKYAKCRDLLDRR